MRPAVTDRLHGTENPGKNLTATADFDARLDDVANTGDAHSVTRSDDIEPSGFNATLLKDRLFDRQLIDG
jgi:hypothetical protein